MKKDINIELLSAYLDGELSPEEIKELEEQLSYKPEMREKLAELKKVKELTKSSVKKIPEAPYFETRLFSYLDDKTYRRKLKRWSPIIGFSALTLVVMVLLKFNPDFFENLFEEQRLNLTGFYKENLKPLLFAADLSNEDIFNFAFYNQLPLDNTKTQYLQVGSDQSGDEYFEINTAGFRGGEGNFEKFVKTLSLNVEQKQQFDSIMSSYAQELQTKILVNDRNTVAISPNLWNFRKAIAADILAFAKTTGERVTNVLPVLFKVESPVVEKVVQKVKTKKDNEYIFFTPDTLFIDEFVFNENKFKKEMELVRENMRENIKELKRNEKEVQKLFMVNLKLDSSLIKLRRAPRVDKNINIFIDSNLCRVHIDKIEIPQIELPDLESLEEIINEATKQVRNFTFEFEIPEVAEHYQKFDFKFEHRDSIESFHFDVPVPDIDSVLRERFNNPEHFNIPDEGWNAPLMNDSLFKWFNYFNFDSTFTGMPENFELRMKEFEEQMQKFREEMEKLKREIRKDSIKVKSKKPVEI